MSEPIDRFTAVRRACFAKDVRHPWQPPATAASSPGAQRSTTDLFTRRRQPYPEIIDTGPPTV